jgi:hypothetical protein
MYMYERDRSEGEKESEIESESESVKERMYSVRLLHVCKIVLLLTPSVLGLSSLSQDADGAVVWRRANARQVTNCIRRRIPPSAIAMWYIYLCKCCAMVLEEFIFIDKVGLWDCRDSNAMYGWLKSYKKICLSCVCALSWGTTSLLSNDFPCLPRPTVVIKSRACLHVAECLFRLHQEALLEEEEEEEEEEFFFSQLKEVHTFTRFTT